MPLDQCSFREGVVGNASNDSVMNSEIRLEMKNSTETTESLGCCMEDGW